MAYLTSKKTAAAILARLAKNTDTAAPAPAANFTPRTVRNTAAHPWQVRFVADTESWAVFLPTRSVIGKTATVAMTHPETAPDDWYTVTPASSGAVTLYVEKDTATGAAADAVKITDKKPADDNLLLTVVPALATTAADDRGRTLHHVTQFVRSAVGLGGGGSAAIPPHAWTIRQNDGQWQVFRPCWFTAPKTLHEPADMPAGDWYNLPASIDTDTDDLFAVLKCTLSPLSALKSAELSVTGDTSGLKDTEPVPAVDRYGGTDGVKHLIFKIGTFGGGTFSQWHVGIIAETPMFGKPRIIVPGALDVIETSSGLALAQYWDLLTVADDGTWTRTPRVKNANRGGTGSVGATDDYAFMLPMTDHADDHTSGLLPD